MSNLEALQEFLQEIADLGQNGDTLLAHITEAEAKKLKDAGGDGGFHPITGLPQFFDDGGEEGASGAGGIGDGSGDSPDDSGDDADSSEGGFDSDTGDDPDDPDAGLDPGEFGSIGKGDIGDSFTSPADSVGGFIGSDPEVGLEFGFDFENFDVDNLAEVFEDVEDDGIGAAIAGFFGFDTTVGFGRAPPGFPAEVETQTTFAISPVGLAVGAAFGIPGKIGLQAAKALGFTDPLALEVNLDTFDVALANAPTPNSEAAATGGNSSSPDDADSDSFSEGDTFDAPVVVPNRIDIANAAEFGLSSEFTQTIEKLLGPRGTFDFFDQPNFSLLDGVFEIDNAALEEARDRVRQAVELGRIRDGAV